MLSRCSDEVLYDQALTDRISILIFGVNPSGSGYVFGFRLDFSFGGLVCFVLHRKCETQPSRTTHIRVRIS